MSTQITIIGLGQIGTSVGLALSGHKEEMKRVGHDLDIVIARQAEKIGAIDRVAVNIPSAVEKSEVVLLSLPSDQVFETLELIAPYLAEGCVVLDTAPIKQAVFDWIQELLPAGRFYVGLIPVINPAYLNEGTNGQEAAHADLFHNGLMAVAAPSSTHPDALQFASDLTRLILSLIHISEPTRPPRTSRMPSSA